jgi:hypothetical protein
MSGAASREAGGALNFPLNIGGAACRAADRTVESRRNQEGILICAPCADPASDIPARIRTCLQLMAEG